MSQSLINESNNVRTMAEHSQSLTYIKLNIMIKFFEFYFVYMIDVYSVDY